MLVQSREVRVRLIFSSTILIFFCLSQIVLGQIPREEHPNPQFYREKWLNLNGPWDFAFDFGKSGLEKNWNSNFSEFDRTILVPFCPESELSGIQYKDFMPAIWYHRTFQIPENWQGNRIFLHFGAVDYDCCTWVNGRLVGRHYGGTVSFDFEITEALQNGMNDLVVLAEDDIRDNSLQPAGKQSKTFFNQGCCKYTRTTGIWQTVWLESRPVSFIESVKIIPDLDNKKFVFIPAYQNYQQGQSFRVTLYSQEGKKVNSIETKAASGVPVSLVLKNPAIWSPANPYLYDIDFELIQNNKTIDNVKSYAGLRKIHIEGHKFFLNNQPIFLRFVLDQGFYPEGVWTAPSDDALKGDIERSMAVGFNGARLHEKVFEERFHYWADKLGYLTWGEFSDWGGAHSYLNVAGFHNLIREWTEVLRRDMNHPSIISWTPLNESGWDAKVNLEAYRRAVAELYDITRAFDPTRPINDASGWIHIKTDIYTVHDYTQDTIEFSQRYQKIDPRKPDDAYDHNWNWFGGRPAGYNVKWKGEPYVVDEYGGTFWLPEYAQSAPQGNGRAKWGYGKNADQVVQLIADLTKILTDNPYISGYTYTQLTDVEQEVNGIYTFDRKLKFDQNRLREAFGQPAAIEKFR
jgi:beta-galactosidase/beta-glucuronidase